MHSLVPLTEQEEQVEGILLQHGITHLTHAVFPVKNRMYVVDFYLPGEQVILECWRSTSRRGVALVWIEKNGCYVDMKFRRIKDTYPGVRSIALAEVMRAEPQKVREYVEGVLEHADFVACSMTELGEIVRRVHSSPSGRQSGDCR